MSTNKFLKASVCLVALASSVAQAQDIYLGGNIGYLLWDDERVISLQQDSGPVVGFNLGYEFAEDKAAELSVNTGFSGPDINLYSLSLYKFFYDRESTDDWSIYMVGGLSYSDMDRVTYPVNDASSLHLGVGASRFLSQNLELRADIRGYTALDSSENFGDDPGSLFDVGTMLALNYHFGRSSAPAPAPVSRPAPAPAAVPAPAPEPEPAPAPPPEPVYETRTVELSVLFNTNADTVVSYGNELTEIAEAMAGNPDLTLTLEGHTDSMGAAEYNRDLSQRRAETVRQRLIQAHGISASRIRAIGYGEDRPRADNGTADGRAQNRRVVGVLSWQERVE